MSETRRRSPYWDNIKGILIFLTVFAHVLYQLQNKSGTIGSIVDYIYMFHMPAFVFASGYFGKSENSRSAQSIVRLVFLYFIFNSIMGFIYGFGSLLEPLYSYWYLIALVAWRLTAHHLAKFRDINLILVIIAIFAGFFPSIDNAFSAARILAFYPYYMMGYQLTTEKNDALIQTAYRKRCPKGVAALVAAGGLAFFAYSFFGYSDNALLMFGYDESIDAVGRVALYVIAFLVIYAFRCICIDRNIPFISTMGRNSLWIFILHRPFTIWVSNLIADMSVGTIISLSLLSTVVICLLFGNDFVVKYLNSFVTAGTQIFTGGSSKKFSVAKLAVLFVSVGFIFYAVKSFTGIGFNEIKKWIKGESLGENAEAGENSGEDIIYPVMSAGQKSAFDDAFRITFSGDLILLEDQVKRGYTGDGYDFSPVFEFSEKYIASADYAIGVFEGPMAGEEAGYSSSNFDDGKELYLNFPDEFGEAVRDSGFDLVTTASNHVLDKGVDGAIRTLDTLDRIGLDHTGSYRNAAEKEENRIKLVECDGIKMAILSYTYGSNYYDIDRLTDGQLSYVTSIISGSSGERFEKLKAEVEKDFEKAKQLDADLIIVLPHIGTQFSNEPDADQKAWFGVFKELGADIILGDHPHVVEPAFIEEDNGHKTFTAYCPGNFANIYREKQGDTSMLIDVYIDRDSKQVIGGGIVPLYTQSPVNGNYRALPIYEIENNEELRRQLSTDDLVRAKTAHDIITNVVFGSPMDISSVTERYYFDESGFIRMRTRGLELTDEMRNGVLYNALEGADTVCFIGDSVTEGTKNGGCPWYEPIEEYMGGKTVYNYSKGGCTVSYMNERTERMPEADLYVIAIGTNDVRYRDANLCAMTAQDYIREIDALKNALAQKNQAAEFVFIAPWYSTDGDPFCSLSFGNKTSLNNEYSEALRQYCSENDLGYINANPYIQNMLDKAPSSELLLDHIHPNSGKGVVKYSEAVLSY